MAKQTQRELLTPVDRLAIRISNMINSPQAQLRRSALIHRLEADSDEAWQEVMGMLSDTDGVTVAHQDDGDVMIFWEEQDSDEAPEQIEDMAPDEEVEPF